MIALRRTYTTIVDLITSALDTCSAIVDPGNIAACCGLICGMDQKVLIFFSKIKRIFDNMAERVGFEPTIRFPVYTLSKRAP